ncbi:MAG: zf-TFIIB domain-containing protein [Thermoanaerobaculia bacterium]
MKCPRDGAVLEPKSAGQETVETCPVCGGMFLEHGQLNRVADSTPGDLEFSTVDLDTFQHEDDHGPIPCPRDGTTMSKVDFNIETTIILDYCKTCHGFWLDAKELERINDEVKRLNEAGEEVPDPLLVRISQFFWNLPVPH